MKPFDLDELVARLQALLRRAVGRSNDPQNLMGAIAGRMGDEDIRAVSAWLANQSVASE